MTPNLIKACFLASVCSFSTVTLADWSVDKSSHINFISIKKGTVAEVHHFNSVKGSLNNNGQLKVVIDLASVESNIGIRNERMREHLFDTKNHPKAIITAKVSEELLAMAQEDGHATGTVPLTVKLHGVQQSLNAKVAVNQLANGTLTANTVAPILVKAADFKMAAGIDKLKALAKLPTIAYSVPVSVQLVLTPSK